MLDPLRDYTDSDLAELEAAELERLASFELGQPALVCRWRLAGGALLMANRHLRALKARTLHGAPISPELCAWVKQHVEWALAKGSLEAPDGVLMLVVDEDTHAAMTVGTYEPLEDTSKVALAVRAELAALEAAENGVAPEVLAADADGQLLVALPVGAPQAGVLTLVSDLAQAFGVPLILGAAIKDVQAQSNVALVSDEHGIVPARDAASPLLERLAACYTDLAQKTAERERQRPRW